MNTTLRWGILGTGNIARQFAAGMATARRGTLAAVGSRTSEAARSFARTHNIEQALSSYQELIERPDVDAVYVSLPNSMHHEWTIKALRAGKHVLCEKPFAVDAARSEEMFDEAEKAGRIVAEAFMYRSHPLTHAVLEAVRGGAIGEVRLIRASFCYRTTRIAGNIRFSRELAGGALMDVGCYCVNFARLFAGAEPTKVHAVARMHETGVDEAVSAVLQFPGGVSAVLACGTGTQADNSASVCGTEGYIEIPIPWKPPARGAVWILGKAIPPRQDVGNKPVPISQPRETRTVDAETELYALEADDFAQAALGGKPPRVSRQDTLGNMRVLDTIREQIGLSFRA